MPFFLISKIGIIGGYIEKFRMIVRHSMVGVRWFLSITMEIPSGPKAFKFLVLFLMAESNSTGVN